MAHIELYQQSEEYIGIIERPKGNRIATGLMRTVQNVPAKEFALNPITSLKMIPDAEQKTKPAIAQLVSCDFDVKPVVATDGLTELWSGPGSLVYNSPSHNDPWYKLSVEEIVQCQYGFFNAFLPYGKVLKSYI